jgi:hypothetical protein
MTATDDHMTTCRDCGRRFRLGPLLDLPQPTRCMECLIGLEARYAEVVGERRSLETALSQRVGMRRELEALLGVGDTYAPEEFDKGVERLRGLVAGESEWAARLAAAEEERDAAETRVWAKVWALLDEFAISGSGCPDVRLADHIRAGHAALRAAEARAEKAERERGVLGDSYALEIKARHAAEARVAELETEVAGADAIVRTIIENHFARITERGILVHGQPVADTGFVPAIRWLARRALAPQEDRP